MAGRNARARAVTAPPTTDQAARIAGLEEQVRLAMAQLAALQRPRLAPVTRTGVLVDTGDLQVGAGDGDVEMDTTGSPTLIRPDIDIPDGPSTMEFTAELAFNEEMVTIKVHDSSEQYPEPFISVWNDGRHQLFVRGMEQTVKRKFIEVLARSKPVRFENVEYVDDTGGRRVKWPRRTSHKYPFAVVKDANPNGAAWLRKVLAQP